MVKRVILVLALAFCGMLMAGCSGAPLGPEWRRQPGMVDSGEDRLARYSLINDVQDRHIVDDWDMIWLYDRANRFSEWHAEIDH